MNREILSPCYFGGSNGTDCHKSSTFYYGESQLQPVKEMSSMDKELLRRRSGLDFTDDAQICSYHNALLMTKFQFLQKTCCNPFGKKKHTVRKDLTPVTIAMSDRLKLLTNKVFKPGQKICTKCRHELVKQESSHQDNQGSSSEDMDVVDACCTANTSLSSLGESPLKLQRVSKRDSMGYLKHKVLKAQGSIAKVIAKAASVSQIDVTQAQAKECQKCKDMDILIEELKIKLQTSSNLSKVQILTLAPNSWSIEKTAEEFAVSNKMVKKARKLKMESGILAMPANRKGKKLNDEVKQNVLNFFEDDEFSRLCPGKKDCVAVRINGEKIHKQKRLLLCNLKEMYIAYCKQYGNQVSFSKFCELRPKWCVTVGASGSHSVCVCAIHQNAKLMLASAASIQDDYKDLMKKTVCSLESKDCMLQRCEDCPGKMQLETFLEEIFKDYDPEEIIEYKQWIHTDRDTLETCQKTVEDFIEALIQKIIGLRSHHFVSKHQSLYLKQLKGNLAENELIILMDFAENYSFVVQDAVQGFHWENSQATLHPFVIYFGGKEHQSISTCMISDCLRHDTIAVHAFQIRLIAYLKTKIEKIKKIYYFSDGSAAQYKNFKNFLNLCLHEEDFGIMAEWNFFGTSHGKSPCDGIGGTAKRLAARASLQRPLDNQILTPYDLFKFCDDSIPGIKFFYVPKEEIEKIQPDQERRFAKGHTIAGTRENHQFRPINFNKLQVSRVSNDATAFTVNAFEADEEISYISIANLQPGQYVTCMYDNFWWVGNVCEVSHEEQDVLISFMHPHGSARSFHWPTTKDRCWIPEQHIFMTLEAPSTSSSGRQYSYPQSILDKIEELFKQKWN